MSMRTEKMTALLSVPTCLALAVSGCGTRSGGTSADSNGPVIAAPEEAQDHPLAGVSGLLQHREGCLLLGGDVVFWPFGARWDEDAQAVVFEDAPQFEDAAAARVGAEFSGGGGWYGPETDFRSWRGDGFADSIERCLRLTNARDVVYAYPSR